MTTNTRRPWVLLAAGLVTFTAMVCMLVATGFGNMPKSTADLGAQILVVDARQDYLDLQAEPKLFGSIDESADGSIDFPSEFTVTGYLDLDRDPEAVGQVFISMLMPSDSVADLRFVGFEPGKVNWMISTNPSCVGTVVEPSGNGSIVILDSPQLSQAGQAIPVVATKFSATAAETIWGPQPVVGSEAGLGLMFLANPTLGIQPAGEQEFEVFRTDTGMPVELPEPASEWVPLYESAGMVLLQAKRDTSDSLSLAGINATADTSTPAWQSQFAAGSLVLAHRASGPLVPVLTGDNLQILDLTTGHILAESAILTDLQASELSGASEAVKTYRDATGEQQYFMLRVTGGYELVVLRQAGEQGWQVEQRVLWAAPNMPELEHFAVFDGRWYVQTTTGGYVLDETTAQVLEYDERLRVPHVFNSAGVGIGSLAPDEPYVMLELQS